MKTSCATIIWTELTRSQRSEVSSSIWIILNSFAALRTVNQTTSATVLASETLWDVDACKNNDLSYFLHTYLFLY